LRSVWKKTTEKDSLIGIGMTGIASGKVLKLDLKEAANIVKNVNKATAELIKINPAARCTLVKPSGTTSLVLGSSSGIHGWHDEFFLRTIRFNMNEDISSFMLVNHPDLCEVDKLRSDVLCVRVPMSAPSNAIMRSESAEELLDRVKKFSTEWIQNGHNDGDNSHNVSATISIKDDEWSSVGDWMWNNRLYYNGLSVLPYDGGSYLQTPFETCTKEDFEKRISTLIDVDLTKVNEIDDNTAFTQDTACAGGRCSIE
jgi:ribonucleoside-triphosphate reductase